MPLLRRSSIARAIACVACSNRRSKRVTTSVAPAVVGPQTMMVCNLKYIEIQNHNIKNSKFV